MISASARRLSVFKSVVDCGGFNVAANQLGIAQPSVGAHVKALEAQLGQPLFQRSRGSRPRLTKAGEAVYAYAVDVLARSEVTTQARLPICARGDAGDHSGGAARRRGVFSSRAPDRLCRALSQGAGDHPRRHHRRDGQAGPRARSRSSYCSWRSSRCRASAATFSIRSASNWWRRRSIPWLASGAICHRRSWSRSSFVTGLRHSRFYQMTDAALKSIGIASYDIAMEVRGIQRRRRKWYAAAVRLRACRSAAVATELNAGSLMSLQSRARRCRSRMSIAAT